MKFSISTRAFLLSSVFLFFGVAVAAANTPGSPPPGQAQCYWPNGDVADPTHLPCNGTVTNSPCCSHYDSCTSSGLCLSVHGWMYRGSCTDQDWKSGACGSYCKKNNPETWAGVFQCFNSAADQGTDKFDMCCGNSPNCCNETFKYLDLWAGFAYRPGLDFNFQANTTSGGSESNTGSAADTTQGAAEALQAKNNNAREVGLGVGLGLTLAVTLIALVVVSVLLARQRKAYHALVATHNNQQQQMQRNPSQSTQGHHWPNSTASPVDEWSWKNYEHRPSITPMNATYHQGGHPQPDLILPAPNNQPLRSHNTYNQQYHHQQQPSTPHMLPSTSPEIEPAPVEMSAHTPRHTSRSFTGYYPPDKNRNNSTQGESVLSEKQRLGLGGSSQPLVNNRDHPSSRAPISDSRRSSTEDDESKEASLDLPRMGHHTPLK